MGRYVNSILAPGESVVYEGKMTRLMFVWPGVVLTLGVIIGVAVPLAGLPIVGVGLLYFLYVYLVWSNSEYVVTNRRVILKTGIISRDTFEMRLEKIESISFSQGILERLLNYGDITVTGTGDTSQEFKNLSDPLKFKLVTEQEMEKRRENQTS
ncbi:MAG: PH domain-containing protein [Desulfovibrio sp.]|nr:PH domain-containing protein [Desulfovibrio sp.]